MRFLKTFVLFTVMVLGSFGVQAQSIHEQNVATVTQTYWQILNRPPDNDGLRFWTYDMDSGHKDAKALRYAFEVATEKPAISYQCVSDYTKFNSFTSVRSTKHPELLTTHGTFVNRDLIGENLSTPTTFYGNVLTINNGCDVTLWLDYANVIGIDDVGVFVSKLYNSSSVEVTYDPVTGVVTSARILEFK